MAIKFKTTDQFTQMLIGKAVIISLFFFFLQRFFLMGFCYHLLNVYFRYEWLDVLLLLFGLRKKCLNTGLTSSSLFLFANQVLHVRK
jgi:hypothetical protein